MHIFASYWANLCRYLWQWHLNNWDTCLCCFWHHSSHGKVCNLFIFRHEIQLLDEVYVILTLHCKREVVENGRVQSFIHLLKRWTDCLENERKIPPTAEQEWRKMAPSGKVASTRHNPTPTPCYLYYIQGRFCFRILQQEIQLRFANRYSDQVGHACHINFLQSLITNFYHYWYKKCWVGSSSSPMGWGGVVGPYISHRLI